MRIPTFRFVRLSIAGKMFLGYLPLALLITGTAAFGLSELGRLSRLNREIVRIDSPMIEANEQLADALLGQELYGRRFLILRSEDVRDLFQRKSAEASALVRRMASLDAQRDPIVGTIAEVYEEYDRAFAAAFAEKQPNGPPVGAVDDPTRERYIELTKLMKEASTLFRSRRHEKDQLAAELSARTFEVMLVLCVVGLSIGLCSAALITRSISGSIHELKLATDRVARGDFEPVPSVPSGDELGDLLTSFADMARKLKHLETMLLDANPLTRLPGGTAIGGVLARRLEAGERVAFCVLDLDNFKPFNDAYGYPRGSEVIKAVAAIVREAVQTEGGEDDFVGHVGGDDFVLITRPDRYQDLCARVIRDFDRLIPDFYAEEDRRRGYIVGKTRQGHSMNFPIMTISIAVVTNERHTLTSELQVGELAAELKDYAKSLPGSVCVVDRRAGGRGASE